MVMTLNLKRCLFFSRKPVNINVSRFETPKLALVPANHYNCEIKNCHMLMFLPSFTRIERGSDGGP